MQHAKARIVRETERFVSISAFLAVFFGAFHTYRSLVLQEYGLLPLGYGVGVIEALVVAKVMLIGEMAKLGERHADKPLIVPVLYKTAVYGLLVLAFEVAEHGIEALIHGGRPLQNILSSLGSGWDDVLARTIVLIVGLVPLCAFLEVDRVLGEGTLFFLFFKRRQGTEVDSRFQGGPDVRRSGASNK
jgi:hypothetical protein